tara:strand:+ start:656 stop:1660 length:1005 start_codon:yes stop_codon:yes gene_type:complete
MELYGIKYLKNVKYANKKFYIDKHLNNDIEDIDLYLDNYSFDNYENITCEKVYDTNPILYCKTLHSCFAHAVVDVLFPLYWAIQDINSQYKEKRNFTIFIREREYKLYPKNNYPLFDNNKNKLKGAWNDLLSSITNNDMIFEHTLKPNTSFLIKDLYIYIINDNWQRSPYNCIDYYPERNIKIKDVVFSDDILVPMLEKFTSHIKTHFNVPLKITNTKKNIIIINRKDDRKINNIDNLIKTINKEKYNYKGVLYLEDLSLKQQVEIFVMNDIIVSPHGAGLINIIWGKNHHIIEITRKDKENRMYQRICNVTNNKLTQINKDNENHLISFISNI